MPVPHMRTMSKGVILNARQDELMFVWFLHVSESEGLERFGTLVELVVVIETFSGYADRRPFGDERSVCERKVSHCLARVAH